LIAFAFFKALDNAVILIACKMSTHYGLQLDWFNVRVFKISIFG